MDSRLYDLHLQAGRLSGEAKTCGRKARYLSEEIALAAASSHNLWKERRHDVEPYPCAFCGQWHIGGIMPIALLEAMAGEPVAPVGTSSIDETRVAESDAAT